MSFRLDLVEFVGSWFVLHGKGTELMEMMEKMEGFEYVFKCMWCSSENVELCLRAGGVGVECAVCPNEEILYLKAQ